MDTRVDAWKRMRRNHWKPWQKVVFSVLVMIVLCLVVYTFQVPNPNMILITGLVVFTALFGGPSGAAAGVIMVVYSMFFFSTDHSFFSYTAVNLQKLVIILLGVLLNGFFVGRLKQQHDELVDDLLETNGLLEESNRVLKDASMEDSLTGLRNRFALRRDYNLYEDKSLHVMMMDLDNFKFLNDTFGHAAGDQVLHQVGKLLRNGFGADHCYRYGGDEFLIIVDSMDEIEFNRRGNVLIKSVEEMQVGNQDLPVTLSGGYVFGNSENGEDLRQMIHQADLRLYEGKNQGKNRITGGKYHRGVAASAQRSLHIS